MTCVTPSPESKTIPVDFPVANLFKSLNTKIRLLEQQRRLQELGTSQKRFKAFFFCA
jgi:hypothetical protein